MLQFYAAFLYDFILYFYIYSFYMITFYNVNSFQELLKMLQFYVAENELHYQPRRIWSNAAELLRHS